MISFARERANYSKGSLSVSEGKKEDRTKRAKTWSFWLLRKLQFNFWAITNYVMRSWTLSESRGRKNAPAKRIGGSRARRRNSETAIKEELILFLFGLVASLGRSNYPANPAKSPRRFHASTETPWLALRAYLAKTFEKTRNPRIGLQLWSFKFNCANYVNLTERKRTQRERERDWERVGREEDSEREVAVSGEAENLVTVFRGGSKALSGRVEFGRGGEQEQSCGRRESKGRLKKFIECST